MMGRRTAVALIPARGGSKRLHRKNVVDFLGRPIIAYTIQAALAANSFDRVVVSTEDDEIRSVANSFGASVHRRRSELAADSAGLVDVCLDYLDQESSAGRGWDVLACLYATAPLRTAEDIRATVALIDPPACEFAIAVTVYDHQPHQALRFSSDGDLAPMWPELVTRRASDLPMLRAGNGSTYVVSVPAFRQAKSFYGSRLKGYDMPRNRSVDIDTSDDLELALWYARRGASRPPEEAT
jgi:pseudaminic acid cytidylyltransferase